MVKRGPGAADDSLGDEVKKAATVVHVGVIADTHGLLRPEALTALKGCDWILHAGDIGGPDVIARLEGIAPVTSIRGNNDLEWAHDMPDTIGVSLGGVRFWLVHNVNDQSFGPIPADADIVVCGHSHRPSLQTGPRPWLLNPGSAGPRRFSLPISVARVLIKSGQPFPEIVMLDVAPVPARGMRR